MLPLLFAACTAPTVLDETFTAENGLSANVAIVVPEDKGSGTPPRRTPVLLRRL